MNTINYKWCTPIDSSSLTEITELFVGNVSKIYISHGEVIDGRANNMNDWKANIKAIMKEEFSDAMVNTFEMQNTFTKLSIALLDEKIIALALVSFYPKTKIAILCDIIVDASFRGQKIGESMLKWIETEIKLWGAKFIFLETGLQNKSAHHFFENRGFKATSVVMVKNI